ncbi:MAG: hypothetical protein AAF799_42110 [Myxococcota bacterium]
MSVAAALVLVLVGSGCGDSGRSPTTEAISSPAPEPKAATADCSNERLIESGEYGSVVLPDRVWSPLVFGVSSQIGACAVPRFELYDLKTRELIARHDLPPLQTPDGLKRWGMQTVAAGGHVKFLAGNNDALFFRLTDGKATVDTRVLRSEAKEYASRLFTSSGSHLHVTPDTAYIDLNDGERVALDLESREVTLTEVGPPTEQELAERHGCPDYTDTIDRFKGRGSRRPYAGGTQGITKLRPERIHFDDTDRGTTLVLHAATERGRHPKDDPPVLMASADSFFSPTIFVPTRCEPPGVDRKLPAPLLVSHGSSLDTKTATSRLSRVADDGATVWTLDTPFPFVHGSKVRYYGSTLFVFDVVSKHALWIDIDEGTLVAEAKMVTR